MYWEKMELRSSIVRKNFILFVNGDVLGKEFKKSYSAKIWTIPQFLIALKPEVYFL